MRIAFPPGFLWGTATASYQIEGSPLADGASPSIWHEFAHTPGRIRDSTNGDIACDHYHLYRQDIRLMRELGLNAYRFSIAWPRIFPEPGTFNAPGLDFYSRLVDGLLEAGIQPWATVFHWDEPVWLERRGGVVRREFVDHLVEYGSCLFSKLGDRVKNWITINEPSVYSSLGYILGAFPPGRRNDLRGMLHSAHHLGLGHARLSETFRGLVRDGRIGMALAMIWTAPKDPRKARDRAAADLIDQALNRFYIEPLFRGAYPARIVSRFGRYLPEEFEKDLPGMKAPQDFVGINYYNRTVYRWALLQPVTHLKEHVDPAAPRSAMWEIYPPGIYRILLRLRDEYGNPPCYITENGFPLPETDGRDPRDDPERVAYLRDHIALVGKAIQRGADCRGYFAWTLMDNFEWTYGHTMRFGLLRTDFATQERQRRSSAAWYQELVSRNWIDVEHRPAPH